MLFSRRICWTASTHRVMRDYFFKNDVDGSKFGHLPKMDVASKGMMGSLMTSTFCERINSCANLVCTTNNSLLSDDEIDMVVTLGMHRDFMQHMRLYYPEVIKSTHPTHDTIVSAQDLLDQNTINNEDDEDLF